MPALTALVQSYSPVRDLERRAAARRRAGGEALTRPVDGDRALTWGATVRDVSATGIGLAICYPFRTGAFLSVEVSDPHGQTRTHVVRVVRATDQKNGSWHIGCEFVTPLDAD